MMMFAPPVHGQTVYRIGEKDGHAAILRGADTSSSDRVPVSYGGVPLTRSQQDSITAIRHRYKPLYNALNADEIDMRTRHKQFLALQEKQSAEVRALLTPAQRKEFDTLAVIRRKRNESIFQAAEAKARQAPVR